jgi:hypothetical protein
MNYEAVPSATSMRSGGEDRRGLPRSLRDLAMTDQELGDLAMTERYEPVAK